MRQKYKVIDLATNPGNVIECWKFLKQWLKHGAVVKHWEKLKTKQKHF